MKTASPQLKTPSKNDNLKNLKSMHSKSVAPFKEPPKEATDISNTARELNAVRPDETNNNSKEEMPSSEAVNKAGAVAKKMASIPVLPIVVPAESKDIKKLEDKMGPAAKGPLSFIKKPAVIFIEGFSAFGISNGDGIKDMAENFPGAKRFSWEEQDKIIEEIKKHSPDQPVVLVGHSFGGDSAVEIANSLNNVKNGFRSIDLLVSIDSVGLNHSIIPMNVKRNLNFFGEGVLPFLHGDPTVARNTDYTEVINELRSELHSKMEDASDVQFKIFQSINEVLNDYDQVDIFEQMQKNESLKELIGNRQAHLKP